MYRKVIGSSLFQRIQEVDLVRKTNRNKCLKRPLSDMEESLKNFDGNLSKVMAKSYQIIAVSPQHISSAVVALF